MNPMEDRRRIVAALGDLTPEDLRAIADGPIMDSNRINLPAGKCSESEYAARQSKILNGEPI